MDIEPTEPSIYVECVCCLQLAEELIQCVNCKRRYHHHCHVPALPDEMPIQE